MKLEVFGGRKPWTASGKWEPSDGALLPCPFCGSEKIELHNDDNERVPSYWAECDSCGAQGPNGNYVPEGGGPRVFEFKTKREATKAHTEAFRKAMALWNREYVNK